MGKLFFAIAAVVASFIMVESLTCNKCRFNVLGLCVSKGDENCTTDTSVCYTENYNFSLVSDKLNIQSMGCRTSNITCSNSTTGTILGLSYTSSVVCCTTDKCNALTLNAAPATRMTFTAAVAGAILATVSGYML